MGVPILDGEYLPWMARYLPWMGGTYLGLRGGYLAWIQSEGTTHQPEGMITRHQPEGRYPPSAGRQVSPSAGRWVSRGER